jgi:hypothetical protein
MGAKRTNAELLSRRTISCYAIIINGVMIGERDGMMNDPWLKFGALGSIGFILGWTLPEYLTKNEISLTPFAGGLMFFVIALVMRHYFRKKKEQRRIP